MKHLLRACVILPLLLSACAHLGNRKTVTLWFHEQVSGALPESRVLDVAMPKVGLRLKVSPNPTLTERDVQAAELHETAGGSAVLLRFDPHGTMALDEMTTRTRGRYLVVFLNGTPNTAWLVDRRLTNGQFLLEGDFSDAQAREIVDELNRMSKRRR